VLCVYMPACDGLQASRQEAQTKEAELSQLRLKSALRVKHCSISQEQSATLRTQLGGLRGSLKDLRHTFVDTHTGEMFSHMQYTHCCVCVLCVGVCTARADHPKPDLCSLKSGVAAVSELLTRKCGALEKKARHSDHARRLVAGRYCAAA
jgi:hypothetical protein